jgi:outer membrane biogenesis lipoprotein LolB
MKVALLLLTLVLLFLPACSSPGPATDYNRPFDPNAATRERMRESVRDVKAEERSSQQQGRPARF